MAFRNKNVLLGVTGSIAAYKSIEIARSLVKYGANVQVVMTDSATKIIGPLTFQAITGHQVKIDLFSNDQTAMEHILLSKWADFVIIAPATANIIAKLAHGIADDLLSTVCLALESTKTIYVVPAMNINMWQNRLVQNNINTLKQYNFCVLDTGYGELACGDVGYGKMLTADQVIDFVNNRIEAK